MSDSDGLEIQGGQLQDFTIDQLAGALALSLGAVGTLLLVIWQSRCLCRCRLGLSDKCYIFDCERAPPPLEEDEDKDKKDKKDKKKVKKDKVGGASEDSPVPSSELSGENKESLIPDEDIEALLPDDNNITAVITDDKAL